MTTKLGQLLVAEGLLSDGDRKTIQEASGNAAGAFARGILALGLLNEEELAAFLADRTHYRVAAKDIFSEIDDRALGAIDTPLLRQLEVLPLRLDSNILAVAMIDPLDRATLHQLEFFTGHKIRPLIATLKQVREGLSRLIPGYQPEPSAFEAFMATHLSALRTSRGRQDRARELVSKMVPPTVRRTGPVEPDLADSAAADPAEPDTQNLGAPPSEPTGATTQGESPAAEPVVGDIAAAQGEAAGPAVEEAPAAPPPAPAFAPKFTVAPAIASNEAAANKALLELNKKLMDMTVAETPDAALALLISSLFGIGIEAGCIGLKRDGSALQGALWSGPDSVAAAGLGDLRGDLTPALVDAMTTHAPEVMESDGWLQIPADDVPAVRAALDLIEPGEPRTAIETALMTSESVLLARAIKLPGGTGDLVAILVWPNASAGHEALRASVSNAIRACSQKLVV